MEMIEQLRGRRVLLRRPVLEDAEALHNAVTSQAEVAYWLTWTPHADASVTADVLRQVDRQWEEGTASTWVLLEADSPQRPAGMFSAWATGREVELGYTLAPGLWGHGLMTEAVALVTERLLEMGDVDRVWATCDAEHGASARVLEKAGFTFEGLLADHAIHPNIEPGPRDSLLFARYPS